MRIHKGQMIHGYPATDVRALLRRWGLASGVGLIQDELRLPPAEAQAFLASLHQAGLITPVEKLGSWGDGLFTVTVSGAALSMASAAPPVQRSVARKRLHELIGRMEQVNADEDLLLGVEEASVFGSYLTSADRLGDLDISYRTYRKIGDGSRYVDMAERAAHASGRRFSSYLASVAWPDEQLRLFLKSRSRVYSLSVDEDLLRDPAVPRRVIFKDRRPVDGWRDL
jgi:hypothetical protein